MLAIDLRFRASAPVMRPILPVRLDLCVSMPGGGAAAGPPGGRYTRPVTRTYVAVVVVEVVVLAALWLLSRYFAA